MTDEDGTSGGTVLLVDDDEMILRVSSEFLGVLGYDVLTSSSGRQALQVYEANRAQVDLVIVDMLMPDMRGDEVLEALKGLDPNIRVLVCSGLSVEHHTRDFPELACDGYLQKPFSMGRLRHEINRIRGLNGNGERLPGGSADA